MALKLKITQVRSGINRPKDQKLTLRGLGLTKMNMSVVLNDTPAIRGMIRKIVHLIEVEPVE